MSVPNILGRRHRWLWLLFCSISLSCAVSPLILTLSEQKSFFLRYFSMTTFNCLSRPWHSSQRAAFSLVDLTLAWFSLVSSWHLGLTMLREELEMWDRAKPSRCSCLQWWDTIAHSFSSVLQARSQRWRVQPKFSWSKLLEMISAFLLNESPLR